MAFRRLGSSFDGRTVTGMGFDRDTLKAAGTADAYAFAAVSSGDNSNILAARVARETFGVECRGPDLRPGPGDDLPASGHPDRRHGPLDGRADDAAAAPRRGSIPELTDPSGKVSVAQVPLHDAWIGERLTRLEEAVSSSRVVYLTRLGGGSFRTATPSTRPATSSTSPSTRLTRVRRGDLHHPHPADWSRPKGPFMRVVIAGAGSVGRSIARELLHNDHQVPARRPGRRRGDTSRVPDAQWLLADACEITALDGAGLGNCDVVVAATGDDKVNLVLSLLAKTEFAVPRTVAGSTNPRTSGSSTRPGGCRCRRVDSAPR